MPGTRRFFLACLIFALVLVVAVPALAGLFAPPSMPDAAERGFAVWQAQDCGDCHSLNGQGGTFAPDLTRIYSTRGDSTLRAFLLNPGTNTIRSMPRPDLTADQLDDLLAFLKWVNDQSAGFPPHPLELADKS